MATIRITQAQADRLMAARQMATYERKRIKKEVFSQIRRDHGIPHSVKFRVAIESPDNPLYLVLRNKHTNAVLTNSLPEPTPIATATTPATSPPMKKTVAKKAPAKKAVAKPVAKKAPAKKAQPAKAAAKAPAAKADGYPKQVRATINGVRVRLGTANDAAHEKRLIAAAKRKAG